jgi:hypothetical protein
MKIQGISNKEQGMSNNGVKTEGRQDFGIQTSLHYSTFLVPCSIFNILYSKKIPSQE